MNLVDPGDTVISCHWGFFGSRLNDFAHRVGADVDRAHRRPRPDRERRPHHGDARREPGDEDRERRARRDLDRRRVPRRRARRGAARERLRRAALRRTASRRSAASRSRPTRGASTTATRARRRRWGARPASRRSRSANARVAAMASATRAPVPYYYDFEELSKYWIDRPITYHHTMPILQYYALYTGIRLALEEGLEARWARNADAGRYFQDEIRARGYELLADPDHQLVRALRREGARGRRRQGDPDAIPPRARHRGRRRARAEGAADLAGRPDGREREPRDRRPGARRVRRRASR